jgi:SAM-dependent methyltransferase
MRLSLIDILKNFLIVIPWIRSQAKKHHRTGVLNDEDLVGNRVDELIEIVNDNALSDASVIEFGPGQTSDTIITLYKNKRFCKASVVDLVNYFTDDFWRNFGIKFLYTDSSSVQKGSVDFIYAYDVLEHVKEPVLFLRELRRIVRSNGMIFLSWDFRDHLNLAYEERWFDMHKYSNISWNLQMSNRSSYVNRLTLRDWIELFESVGLEISKIETLKSKIASNAFEIKYGCKIDPTYRAKVLLKPT